MFSDSLTTVSAENCGDSPQNIQSPIEYREFSLLPKFKELKNLSLIKVNTGELHIKGDFGFFDYNGANFGSILFILT
jgi:hypothetical protein